MNMCSQRNKIRSSNDKSSVSSQKYGSTLTNGSNSLNIGYDMLHPKYDLQVGSAVLKPESSNENISMTVSASMNSPSDTFEGTFRSSGQAIDIKKEDILKLSLGYEDGMSDVFHGKVEDLIFRTFDMRIIAYSSTFNLSRVRKDKFYEAANSRPDCERPCRCCRS